MHNKRFGQWINSLFLGLFLSFTFSLISIPVCANAADTYYGERIDGYYYLKADGTLSFGRFYDDSCFVFGLRNGKQFNIAVFSPSSSVLMYNLVSSKFNVNNFTLSSTFDYDGITWYYSTYALSTGSGNTGPIDFAIGVPENLPFFPYSVTDSFVVYYEGYKLYSGLKSGSGSSGGGGGGSSVDVDLSTVESSLDAIEQLNTSNNATVETVNDKLDTLLTYTESISANTGNIDTISTSILQRLQDDSVDGTVSENVQVIRVYIVLCFIILTATLFRHIFAQWLRNTTRR